MRSSPRSTLARWRAIQDSLCSFFGRSVSMRSSEPASSTPSASASQRCTAMRSRFSSGMRRLIGETWSRNSTITRES